MTADGKENDDEILEQFNRPVREEIVNINGATVRFYRDDHRRWMWRILTPAKISLLPNSDETT